MYGCLVKSDCSSLPFQVIGHTKSILEEWAKVTTVVQQGGRWLGAVEETRVVSCMPNISLISWALKDLRVTVLESLLESLYLSLL
jgi:hypothetical protein